MKRHHPGHSLVDEFLAEAGDQNVNACFSCGTCTSSCPVSWTNEAFNPRRILRLTTLGAREEVLSSPAIWLCSACDICYGRCPQKVHLSELMKAIRTVAAREGYTPDRWVVHANRRKCSSCGMCVQTCPYGAIELRSMWVQGRQQVVLPAVDEFLCMECGVCTATCPVSAINQDSLDDGAYLEQLDVVLARRASADSNGGGSTPSIVVFLCDWCLYSELDRAEILQVENDKDVDLVRIPCLGRMDPMLVLAALQGGIKSVLVVGCELGNCHYRHGNLLAENRMTVLRAVLAASGDSSRVTFAHISPARRGILTRLVKQVKQGLTAATSNNAEGTSLRSDVRSASERRAATVAATSAAVQAAAYQEAIV